jgi:hypothetical protein
VLEHKGNFRSEQAQGGLIPDFLGPGLTVLSGPPKVGKTTFAAHLVKSVVHQQSILGKIPKVGAYEVLWIGFDADFNNELAEKFPELLPNIYIQNGFSYLDREKWDELIKAIIARQINFVVIDNLAALAGDLDLDKQHQMSQALYQIEKITLGLGIPVLLLAHASKMSRGRAAHSYLLEGKARTLLRLSGESTNGKRTLEIVGNRSPQKSLNIILKPEVCELVPTREEKKTQAKTSRDRSLAWEEARAIVEKIPFAEMKNDSAMGRWLHVNQLAATPEAGRSKVNRWKKMDILKKAPGGRLTWSESLVGSGV